MYHHPISWNLPVTGDTRHEPYQPPFDPLLIMRPTIPVLSRTSIQEWISSTLAQGPSRHTDTIDSLRASHLLRTLPTRQHSLPSLREGDELIKGGNMIYFQPETMLSDLGRDGSSTVSHVIFHLTFHSTTSFRYSCYSRFAWIQNRDIR
jgi:hypothetical protein